MILHYEILSRDQFEIEKGTHRFDSLFIPLSGSFEYIYNETRLIVPAFTPILFKKGLFYQKKVIEPMEFIIIRFSNLPESVCLGTEYQTADQERLKSSIGYLRDAIFQNAPTNVIEHFTWDILLLADSNRAAQEGGMAGIAKYINEHCDKKISLEFLSGMVGYSKQTLIKKFSQQYRRTPVEYITMVRINKAKSLLTNTAYSVGVIAEMCGYNNPYYFSNTFKKQTGLSPLGFRQKSKL